jgi:hypothetical protein
MRGGQASPANKEEETDMNRFLGVFVLLMACLSLLPCKLYAKDLDVGAIELFGVKLRDASREEFRKACRSAYMVGPIKSRDIQGVMTLDVYKVTGQLEGATQFSVMCAADTGELVSASYDFKPGVRWRDVVYLVSTKYGQPGESREDSSVYRPAAFWPRADADWSIHVMQDDDGDVDLTYVHMSAFERCLKKSSERTQAEKMKRSKAQGNAF